MPVFAPAGIAAAASIYNIVAGNSAKKKADKLAASIKRPEYNIPQNDYDNLDLLKARAGIGLSSASTRIATEGSDRALSASLSAILQGGGNANDAGKVYQNYMDGINNVTLANDQQHLKNIDSYINANYRMSDQQDKAWQINKYAPYADNQRSAAQMRAQGAGQMNAGINGLASAAMGLASGFTGGAGRSSNGDSMTNALIGSTGGGNGSALGQASTLMSNSGAININNDGSQAISPDTVPVQQQPFYGLDITKMNPKDASMVGRLLGYNY